MEPVAGKFKDAVSRGDAAALRQLFADYPDMKAHIDDPVCAFECPAIVSFAAQGNREIIDVLLDNGADINARSTWWAGSFGVLDNDNHEMAGYLIGRGAKIDAHAAARHNMLEKLRELIDRDPELVHARGGDGQTPLHVAGSIEVAEFLLTRGAGIDAKDIDHESTPAQYLVRSHPEIVRFLIARGCRTDILLASAVGDRALVLRHLQENPESIRTRVNTEYFPMRNPRAGGTIYIWTLGQNRSPHRIAKQFHHEDVLQLLFEHTPEDLRAAELCLTGDYAAIRSMVARDPEKVRALARANPGYVSEAAQDNNSDAVKLMLECGWPVEGNGRQTPLHWACWHGNAAMVRDILRFNPPLELRDPDHQGTPLGWLIHGSENSWHRKTGDYAAAESALRDAGARTPT